MKNFEVFKLENEKYNYLVLLKSTHDFYMVKDELDKVVKNNNKVLVDLIIRNGFQFNRFFEYIAPCIDDIKMVLPNDVNEKIKAISMNYIMNNISILSESSLSRKTINIIQSIYKHKTSLNSN